MTRQLNESAPDAEREAHRLFWLRTEIFENPSPVSADIFFISRSTVSRAKSLKTLSTDPSASDGLYTMPSSVPVRTKNSAPAEGFSHTSKSSPSAQTRGNFSRYSFSGVGAEKFARASASQPAFERANESASFSGARGGLEITAECGESAHILKLREFGRSTIFSLTRPAGGQSISASFAIRSTGSAFRAAYSEVSPQEAFLISEM